MCGSKVKPVPFFPLPCPVDDSLELAAAPFGVAGDWPVRRADVCGAACCSSHERTSRCRCRHAPRRGARGKPAPPSPVRQLAASHGHTVHAPESINSPEAHELLRAWQPDLLVVCDYGQILSRETLSLARLGGINLHGSLLPAYRGAAPIQWAIYHGETETGITVIHMTPLLDGGPCLVQTHTPIGDNETNVELEPRLAELGIAATLAAITQLATGQTVAIPQDAAHVSKAPRLQKSAGQIDWTRPAVALYNQIRALVPWPKSFTAWQRAGSAPQTSSAPLRIIIDRAVPHDDEECLARLLQTELYPEAAQQKLTTTQPGETLLATSQELWVRCGDGALELLQLQPESKKSMSVADFLRGNLVRPGNRWG